MSKKSLERVVITGANGFVGRRLVLAALERGWQATALSRDVGWLASLASERLTIQRWDCEDSHSTHEAVRDADAVFHAAAYLPANYADAAEASPCFRVNAVGTAALLDAAAQAGVQQFIYFSSLGAGAVYPPGDTPADESEPAYPDRRATFYLASKIAGETIASYYGRTQDMTVACLRLASVYGPGMPSTGLLPKFIGQALAGKSLQVHNGGRYRTDLVHVDDVVHAAMAACERNVGGLFNIASGQQVSVLELAQWVIDATGASPSLIDVLPAPADPVPADSTASGQRPIDISRARRLLGLEATEIRDGLRKMLSHFRRADEKAA